MQRMLPIGFLAAGLGVSIGCGDNLDDSEPVETIEAVCHEAELEALIRALPSVRSATSMSCGRHVEGPARCFHVVIDQPVHQLAPDKIFAQHLYLVHRGCERPTVVADWGYETSAFFDDELSTLFEANSLWIEHRFQGESIPAFADWDWKALTIENGAHDMHDVISSFKHLYGGRWVSTGASKGGVTATYHAFFFPRDVDGVIPYVAPASRARLDSTYQTYLDTEMSRSCGQRVRDAQVAALTTRRTMMLAQLGELVGHGQESLYLEQMTSHFDWGFWQGFGARYCNQVPSESSSDEAFWTFYKRFSWISPNSGARGPGFEALSSGALYYEWLSEQGFALQIGAHVRPHLQEPFATATMEEWFRELYPTVELPGYDGAVTRSVRRWASRFAENLMFIYGEYDPWSGGAFDRPERPTSARFFVPGANHSAQLGELPPAERTAALAHATRMFGRPPTAGATQRAIEAGKRRDEILRLDVRHGLMRLP